MDENLIIFLILIGMGAGFIQRVSGFGLGIFVMMFLPHLMPSHTAAATISSIFSLGTSTYNTVIYRKSIAYKTAIPMLITAVPSIPIAVYFSKHISSGTFKILLGGVLMLLSIYFLFFNKKMKLRPTTPVGLTVGVLSGVLGGLFSTGGPPAVLYLSHALTENICYFATIQFYFCLTNIYATAMRAVSGIVTTDLLILSAIGFAGCMAGDYLGKFVFERLDSNKLRCVIYVGMLFSGALMLLNL